MVEGELNRGVPCAFTAYNNGSLHHFLVSDDDLEIVMDHGQIEKRPNLVENISSLPLPHYLDTPYHRVMLSFSDDYLYNPQPFN